MFECTQQAFSFPAAWRVPIRTLRLPSSTATTRWPLSFRTFIPNSWCYTRTRLDDTCSQETVIVQQLDSLDILFFLSNGVSQDIDKIGDIDRRWWSYQLFLLFSPFYHFNPVKSVFFPCLPFLTPLPRIDVVSAQSQFALDWTPFRPGIDWVVVLNPHHRIQQTLPHDGKCWYPPSRDGFAWNHLECHNFHASSPPICHGHPGRAK